MSTFNQLLKVGNSPVTLAFFISTNVSTLLSSQLASPLGSFFILFYILAFKSTTQWLLGSLLIYHLSKLETFFGSFKMFKFYLLGVPCMWIGKWFFSFLNPFAKIPWTISSLICSAVIEYSLIVPPLEYKFNDYVTWNEHHLLYIYLTQILLSCSYLDTCLGVFYALVYHRNLFNLQKTRFPFESFFKRYFAYSRHDTKIEPLVAYDPALIQTLEGMGFPKERIMEALQSTQGDLDQSLALLIQTSS